MRFELTLDQHMLRDVTRELLSRESPISRVRAVMDDPLGYSPSTWQYMVDMGLPGLAVSAEHGGQGLGVVEQAVVLEEMARAALPSPYFASAVLASRALQCADDTRYLPELASGRVLGTLALEDTALRASNNRLIGEARFVPWAHVADLLLVPADGGLFLVERDAPGLTRTDNLEMDRTNRTSNLRFEDVPVVRVAARDTLGLVRDVAAVSACAEMLGAARRCMEMSVEYAKVRHQFGQPIGTFQAIKHACADMLLDIENSYAATYYAAWALDAGSLDSAMAVSAAKAYVSEATRRVCGAAIQVHGGIGFTWEYDLHLYVKRAKHFEPRYGSADSCRERALQDFLERMDLAAP
jgi:alkylation response protein AidB-like acyl-CoA dehydrogenase